MHKPIAETSCAFIDTLEDLVALNEKLSRLSEFAVDLEVPEIGAVSYMTMQFSVVQYNCQVTAGTFTIIKMLTSCLFKFFY